MSRALSWPVGLGIALLAMVAAVLLLLPASPAEAQTPPSVSITAVGAVTEGAPASFIVARTGATTAALTVLLAVSENEASGRDFVTAANQGNKQVVIPIGDSSVAYNVPTVDDSTDEPNGAVTVALRSDSAYTIGTPSSATVTVLDDDAPAIAPPTPATISSTSALVPDAINLGQRFRLLFVTSTTRNASSTDIADYNSFVQARAAAGHTDIRPFASQFRVLGSTDAVNARVNTATTGSGGVPIYWVNGDKVADHHVDLYDGSWDNQDAGDNRDESGAATASAANGVFTGTESDGTTSGAALGDSSVKQGRPHTGNAPLALNNIANTSTRPFYALSPVLTAQGTTSSPEVAVRPPSTEGSTVVEGRKAYPESVGMLRFALSARPAPTANLDVCVRVTESTGAAVGDRVASGLEGIKTVTLNANTGDGAHTIAITDTAADDRDSILTVTVVPSSTAGCSLSTTYTAAGKDSDSALLQDDETTTIALTSTDMDMTEGDAGDTAQATVTLSRRLQAGEVAVVPVALTTTTGARLPGHATPDFAVSVSGTGVTTNTSNPASPVLTFTGHDTNTVQTATVTFTPVAGRNDSDTADEAIKFALASDTVLGGTGTGTMVGGGSVGRDADDYEVDLVLLEAGVPTTPTVTVTGGSAVTEGTPASFTVSRTGATTSALTVLLTVSENESGGRDFVTAANQGNKQVVIAANQSSATYTVPTVGDSTDEPNGAVTVSLRSDSAYTSGSPSSATVTVNDNDPPPPPTVTVTGGGAVTEGTGARFTVRRTGATTSALTVLLTVSEDRDFVASGDEGNKQVVIPANQPSAIYTVATVDDTTDEPNGTVTVSLRTDSAYTSGSPSSATVTVYDNEGAELPTVTVTPFRASVSEGDLAWFELDFDRVTTETLHVAFRLDSPTRTIADGACVIGPGVRSVNLRFDTGDDHHDPDGVHEYTVTLLAPGLTFYNYRVGSPSTATVSVTDDDGLPAVSFAEPASRVWERDGTHAVRVNVSPTSEPPLTLSYTVGGTATAGTDYAALSGTVRVPPGAGSVTIPVTPVDDGVDEGNETVVLTLAGGSGFDLRRNVHTVTVVDDRNWAVEAPPRRVTVSYAAGHDVNGRTSIPGRPSEFDRVYFDYRQATVMLPVPRSLRGRRVSFTIGVSHFPNEGEPRRGYHCGPGVDIIVRERIVRDRIVRDPSNYVRERTLSSPHHYPTTGVPVALCPSAIGKTFEIAWYLQDIRHLGDGFDTSAPNCERSGLCRTWVTVVRGTATPMATAQSQDAGPTAQFGLGAMVVVHEADVEVGVVVTLSAPAPDDVVVDWEASGTATFGTDYDLPGRSTQAGMVTIAAGSRTATIPVRVLDDTVEDSGETVVLTLTDIAGGDAVLGTPATFTLTIENYEGAPPDPVVSVTAGSGVTEGGAATFTVSASPAPTAPLTVSLSVSQSGDYAASGTTGTKSVTIPTTGSATYSVPTVNDTTDEADGSVTVVVSGGNGYTVGRSYTATVAVSDDDATPQQQPEPKQPATPQEGPDLDAPAPTENTAKVLSNGDVLFGWPGARANPNYLLRAVSYDGHGQRWVRDYTKNWYAFDDLQAGRWLLIVYDMVASRRVGEWLTLQVPERPAAQDNTPTPTPTVSIAAGSGATEGGTATFTVSASPAPTAPLTVSLTVSQNGDYAASGSTGSKSVSIPTTGSATYGVATVDDTADEADGSVTVAISSGQGYSAGSPATATVSVADNDVPAVSIAAGSGVTEGGTATFTVTANPTPHAALSVSVSVAQSGDFGATTGSQNVTIPTSGTATLSVATGDDATDEAHGSITATVSGGSGYTIGTPSTATVNVSDNDDPPAQTPVVSIAAGSGITEGGSASFTVSASPAPTAPLAVSLSVSQSGDYAASGTTGTKSVTIPTSGSVTYSIATTDDSADETDGSVSVAVSSGNGYSVGSPSSATVNVVDNDDPPTPSSCVTTDADLVSQVEAKVERHTNETGREDLKEMFSRSLATMKGKDDYTTADIKARPDKQGDNWQGPGPNPLWQKIYTELDRLETCRASE